MFLHEYFIIKNILTWNKVDLWYHIRTYVATACYHNKKAPLQQLRTLTSFYIDMLQ